MLLMHKDAQNMDGCSTNTRRYISISQLVDNSLSTLGIYAVISQALFDGLDKCVCEMNGKAHMDNVSARCMARPTRIMWMM
jgi:hypothetical protein